MKFMSSLKKKPRPDHEYIYVAIDQESKCPINFHYGIRSSANTKLFLDSVLSMCKNINTIHSDAYPPYVTYLKKCSNIKHTISKKFTTHIESFNSVLRHRLSMFNRRSRNIAKNHNNLVLVINLFFYHFILQACQI